MWLKSLSYEVYSYMQLMLDCNFFLNNSGTSSPEQWAVRWVYYNLLLMIASHSKNIFTEVDLAYLCFVKLNRKLNMKCQSV